MNKIKLFFTQNIKSLLFITIALLSYFFLIKENDELLEKLNNNKELIKKYNEFKDDGVNKSIVFPEDIIENVIDTALSYIGTPNKYGGINKKSIDASGLIYMSLTKNSDIVFPRIAQEMARYGEIIVNPNKLIRGDLLFFFNTYEVDRIITSVGIYLGDGKFVVSSTREGVSISEINSNYWKEKFFFGTRILN